MYYRDYFVGLDHYVQLENGGFVSHVNFDNGTTTPPLASAVKIIDANLDYYASSGRGVGQKAQYCREIMEEARKEILGFFHLEPDGEHTIFYVKSASEGIHLLAYMLADKNTMVVSTRMEHCANDLPWQKYAGMVEYLDVDDNGRLNLTNLEEKLALADGKVKYVTVTAASNVTGYLNHTNKIAKICHEHGAKIIVDATQATAHLDMNMAGENKMEQIDFFVFSAHKAYAPFGAAAVVGLREILDQKTPFYEGESYDYNFFGILAMAEALKKIKEISFQKIGRQEEKLKNYIYQGLLTMNHVILFGDQNDLRDQLSFICFNVKGVPCKNVSLKLARDGGISTGYGMFCAKPYVMKLISSKKKENHADLNVHSGMVRISLCFYNTMKEADLFLNYIEYMKPL